MLLYGPVRHEVVHLVVRIFALFPWCNGFLLGFMEEMFLNFIRNCYLFLDISVSFCTTRLTCKQGCITFRAALPVFTAQEAAFIDVLRTLFTLSS